MILLLVALLQEPPPLDIQPFMDEKPAAHAFEELLACLGGGGFERRNDPRDVGAVASDVVKACDGKAAKLRATLRDVYFRKPALVPIGSSPEEATDLYIAAMKKRMEFVIAEERKHR
ncbi:MAG TPA: hypothetical protein VF727_09435 [Allosphingosinicella sp.]